MSGIDSSRNDRLFLAGWALTAVVNSYLMYVLPGKETIPFHLVWIGLSVVYGLTFWRPIVMAAVLAAVALTTGYILVHHASVAAIGWEETTEVPLMAAVFGVMVWHVRRRQQMVAEVARLADVERRRADSQDRFVRLASHELRTPITIARGYTELVRAATGDPEIQEDTRIVLEELDRLAGITQRLVTLIQMDGRYVREMRDVDLVLAGVVRRWRPAADRQWSVRSTIGTASINQDRLEVALDCLLENAVKFTRPGDRIEVGGSGARDSWTIVVADSGTGMSPERVEALSKAGVPPAPPGIFSGTGLGLAIVRAVVGSWGGSLRLNSEPGVGTTVSLVFPRFAAQQASTDMAPAPQQPRSAAGG
ncbi:sensor histidine kinase [Micromonospora inositola]|uniref:histidine kinase n=1 Tax=Micromonospora inositola TaxID=47865 RepID=A0A1C5K2Q6_9ACTN|nr:HAMP domain-containing sensor histidine kinase [Micromonospora inositola]SCG77100.1 Signal transduction histidine kinase [Micromonospora inositola]